MFGLTVVPALYAWFNIFSNWDPYGPSATGRIRVAVTSVDEGVDVLGLKLNVGQKVIDGLEANDTIGWVFVDGEDEVIKLVDSGNCYAGIVVPQDFSKDVASFMVNDLKHPTLEYYENQKKNAIAPKITGKAKTAVQETVNETFAETIASVAASVIAIADNQGLDYDGTLDNVAEKLTTLDNKLTETYNLVGSVCRFLDATETLMYYTSVLSGDVAETSYLASVTADNVAGNTDVLNTAVDEMNTAVKGDLEQTDSRLADIAERAGRGELTPEQLLEALNDVVSDSDIVFEDDISELRQEIESGATVTPDDVADLILAMRKAVLRRLYRAVTELGPDLEGALDYITQSAESVADTFGGVAVTAQDISATLYGIIGPLNVMEADLYKTREDILDAQEKIREMQKTVGDLKDSDYLRELTGTLSREKDELAPYFASPIRMNTVQLYPIANYGSAMAPFYTVLAQWVGALFCVAIMKARVREEHMEHRLSVSEEFFGRYGVFFAVGMLQALVTALGDIVFINIYCLHPGLFILAACVTGLCFTLINFSLLFSLEKIGLGASVIIMVVQVAGSGGSYPIEVVPPVFRALYPFMPFNYAMNAMREAVAGTYGFSYWKDILVLLLISLIFIVLGLAIYRPVHRLNKMISESAEKSEIML